VTVYSATASGNALMQIINGSNTRLVNPASLAMDAAGEIFVTNEGFQYSINAVTVYAPGAHGNVSPIRRISGARTGLAEPVPIAVGSSGRIFVANLNGGPSGLGSVTVYAPNANGDAAPIRTIAGSKTGLAGPIGLALGPSGELYVANQMNPATVTVYDSLANGNATPIRTIEGSPLGLTPGFVQPGGIALDSSGELFVTNTPIYGENSVAVYAAGANGYAKPIRTIGGSKTELAAPSGVALDASGQVYVANDRGGREGQGSVTVYAPKANGNVAPIWSIGAPSSELMFPGGLSVR